MLNLLEGSIVYSGKKWCNMIFFKQMIPVPLVQFLDKNTTYKTNQFFYASWRNKGINNIYNLLYNNGIILSYNGFSERFPGVNTNFLIYQGLILNAIPREWKNILKGFQLEDADYSYMVEKVVNAEKSTKLMYSETSTTEHLRLVNTSHY